MKHQIFIHVYCHILKYIKTMSQFRKDPSSSNQPAVQQQFKATSMLKRCFSLVDVNNGLKCN